MSNIDRYSECPMRTALGNCDPIGGFCTSVNKSICEALHKVSRPYGKWIANRYVDGEWISHRIDFYKCSICDKIVNLLQMHSYNFCPNCGAKMIGEEIDEKSIFCM